MVSDSMPREQKPGITSMWPEQQLSQVHLSLLRLSLSRLSGSSPCAALTENHPSFAFPTCLCKQPSCRGHITGNDWKMPELQARYGQHFHPHVLKGVEAMKAQQAGEQTHSSADATSSN